MVLSLTHSGRSQGPTSGHSLGRVDRTRSRGPDSALVHWCRRQSVWRRRQRVLATASEPRIESEILRRVTAAKWGTLVRQVSASRMRSQGRGVCLGRLTARLPELAPPSANGSQMPTPAASDWILPLVVINRDERSGHLQSLWYSWTCPAR